MYKKTKSYSFYSPFFLVLKNIVFEEEQLLLDAREDHAVTLWMRILHCSAKRKSILWSGC